MKRALLVAILASCGGSPKSGPPPIAPAPMATPVDLPKAEPPRPSDPRLAADLASFDMMWTKINDTFWDPKAIDWARVKTELRPKVEQSKDRDETRKIMQEALKRLGRSHFALWTTSPEPENSKGEGEPGFEVRVIGGKAYVTRVEIAGSAEAKVKLGDEVQRVGDIDVAAKLAELDKDLQGNSLAPLYEARLVQALLEGELDSMADLTLVRNAKPIKVSLKRVKIGRTVSLGNLGAHTLIYETRSIDKDIGYIRLSIFLDPQTVMTQIQKDLVDFKDKRGVVVDLRGNPGGIGGMAMGIAGDLVTDAGKKLGTMTMKASKLDFVVNPQVQHYDGKLAILIDPLSASTSEILAAGLQDLKRGKVFGRTSAGAALPSVIEMLPNGDRIQYAIADYQTASGRELEGQGVIPDVPVDLDLKVLRAGKDPDMVAASKWIKEKP